MKIDLRWYAPVRIRRMRNFSGHYECPEMHRLYEEPGLYVFGRPWKDEVIPIYIGQSLNVRKRVGQHLDRNARLARAIYEKPTKRRVLLHGYLNLKSGQSAKPTLELAERILINAALADGHDLVNVSGARRKVHTLSCSGNLTSRRVFGGQVTIERR